MADGRVLVVDDEEGIRVLCRVNLEFGGYEVLEASDGEEAVAVAQSSHPDVIFLDVMMPVVDGWEALRRLKADPATADIPVVLLTARTGEEDQVRAWKEGVFDYLAKPFSPQMLLEEAGRALLPPDPEQTERRRQRNLAQLEFLQKQRRGHSG